MPSIRSAHLWRLLTHGAARAFAINSSLRLLVAALCGLLSLAPARAQLGPLPGLPASSLNQPNGPAQLDALGHASTLNAIATGGTTARMLADINAERINVKNFGAQGDGTTDDSAAIAAAMNRSIAILRTNAKACVYFPGGVYRIAATPLPLFRGVSGCVQGDGPQISIIQVDPAYVGDVFAWSDAWLASCVVSTACVPAGINYGPRAHDISVEGTSGISNVQNAFMLYDHDDYADFQDIVVENLNGRCLGIGDQKLDTVALVGAAAASFTRESKFSNIRCSGTGIPGGVAAVTITATGSQGDTVNQLKFYDLNVFPNGPALTITNAKTNKGVGNIYFFGARFENPLVAGTDDLVTIGSPTLPGQVTGVFFYGFTANASFAGHDSIKFVAPSAASQPYNILLDGSITSGAGNGVDIQAGRSIELRLNTIATSGTGLIVGPSTLVGRNILLRMNGAEQGITTDIDPTSLSNVHSDSFFSTGDPATGLRSLSAYLHDGSTTFGGPLGAGSVDWQQGRTAQTQIASGPGVTISGGTQNSGAGTNQVIAGGFGNSTGGSLNSIGGGQANILSGTASAVPGGLRSTDRARYGWLGWASGFFAAIGDGQSGQQLLRGLITTAAGVRLLSDGSTTPSNANSGGLPITTHYHTRTSATCRDNTGVGWATWDELPGDLDHSATASATYVGGYSTATAPTRSAGTLTGMTLTIGADTSIQGISVTATPAAGNTNHIHCLAHFETTEEVQ